MANTKSSLQMGNEFNGYGERVYLRASKYKTYPPLSHENVRTSSDYGNDILKAPGALPVVLYVSGWEKQTNGKWKYMEHFGVYIRGDWKEDNGQWYYLDDEEFMVLGWKNVGGVWYYFQEYKDAGYMVISSWQEYKGKWYYLKSDGSMATSMWIRSTTTDKQYRVDENGVWVETREVKSGWKKQSDGRWKYMDETGAYVRSNWQEDNNQMYYLDDNEFMVLGWKQIDGKRYYFQEDSDAGYMVTSHWVETDGKWYYLKADGAMATDIWIDSATEAGKSYYVDANGVWDENAKRDTLAYENVEKLTTAQVAAIQTARSTKEVIDLLTGKTFNISWAASKTYHTDWTPMTPADTDVIKSLINPNGGSADYWAKTSSWSWDARPGILKLNGRLIAVGFHCRPHAAIMGGNPGPPFVSDSNTSPKKRNPPLQSWPMGGHMCMYYGDSPGGTPKCNTAAEEAFRLCQGT